MQPISEHEFSWRNVRGWLTDDEAAELARLATDKVVLEVGTFCGKSALAMADTARRIYCMDNFVGYSCEASHYKVREEALGNFDRAGVGDKVVVLAGSQEDVLPKMNLSEVDMVFYDADHSEEGTSRAIRLLHDAGLRPEATAVFHDYDVGNPGVITAVNNHYMPRVPRTVDSLAIFDGVAIEEPVKDAQDGYKVMLAMPTFDDTLSFGAAQGLFRATWKHHVKIDHTLGSLLANRFNLLWCAALNRYEAGDITHLAFLHADISPCDGWIDILIREMEKKQVPFISAVSPLKDSRGLTSTAIGEPGFPWSPLRRLAMKEIMNLPGTFGIEDTEYPDKVLLLNSGCWVADLRDERFFARNSDDEGLLYFEINDRIVKTDGKWVHQVESEDWFFSRQLHAQGIPTAATREVTLKHRGSADYINDREWGTQKCDEDLRPMWDTNGKTRKPV